MEELVENDISEITQLKCTIKTLENKLCKSEHEHYVQMELYQKNIKELQFELNKTKNDVKFKRDRYDKDIFNVRNELKLRAEEQNVHQSDVINNIREKLQEEKAQVCMSSGTIYIKKNTSSIIEFMFIRYLVINLSPINNFLLN